MASPQSDTPATGPKFTLSDPLPSPDILAQLASLPVLSADGSSHTFGSLYADGAGTMIVFVRHAYCTVCQSYVSPASP